MTTIININIGQQSVSAPALPPKKTRELPNPLPFIYAGLTPLSHPFGRAKNCVKGQVCGNSCISKSKKCSNGLSPAQKPAAKKAATKATKKTSPKTQTQPGQSPSTQGTNTGNTPQGTGSRQSAINKLDQEISKLSNGGAIDFAKVEEMVLDLSESSKQVTLLKGEANDAVLKQLISLSNYDALPTVLNSQDFNQFIQDNNSLVMIRSVRDSSDIDGKKIMNQLREGQNFIGKGIYGNGTYATHTGDDSGAVFKHSSGDDETRESQLIGSRIYGNESIVMTMATNSKILLQKDAVQMVDEFRQQLGEWRKTEIESEIKRNPPPSPSKQEIAKAKPIADQFESEVIDKASVSRTGKNGKLWTDNGLAIKHADGSVEYIGDTGSTKKKSSAGFLASFKEDGAVLQYKDRNGGLIEFSIKDPRKVDWSTPEAQSFMTKVATDRVLIRAEKNNMSGAKEWEMVNGSTETRHREEITKTVNARANLIEDTLIGDVIGGSSARLATIMRYDAIACGDRGENYMNVLNRKSLIIRSENLPSSDSDALKLIQSLGK